MRTAGSISSPQTLTTEAASVLKHSLALARRRGHAQVTPLHVAATLLSPKSSLLKSACFKSHTPLQLQQPSLHHYPPLQCRALELCFNVALNRLPTTPTPLLHSQPSLSNALIAALKRAQAHQRRGCIEQQQQQPLLAIKVELEQLILSILDDPSVSRVMREAGFSSTAVKHNIEENFSSFSSSPVFNCYSSNGGVYSSPPSPPDHQAPSNLNFWQNPFWKQKLGQTTQFLFPNRAPGQGPDSEDIKLILEVLLKKRRKNIVIVGDSLASTEGLVSETMDRIEKGDVPEELKTTHFIKFQFSSVPLGYMKKDEVELNVAELKRKVDSFLAMGKGVIVYTGDLKWTLDHESESRFGYNPVDHLVADIGKLIGNYNNDNGDLGNTNKGRVWLMGTANYQTYMRCQMKQPSLEVQWCLQAVSVPSSGLGLSLHATSVQESRITLSQNPSQATEDTKPLCRKEGDDKITCCDECTSKYEKEAAATWINNDLDKSSSQLPLWLQSHTTDKQKDDLVELRRKWNRLCNIQHQARPIQNNANSSPFNNRNSSNDKSYTYPSSNPSWPNPNNLLEANSISFAHSNSKPMHTTSSYPRFRRQQSCHIEFSYENRNHEHQIGEPNLDSLKNTEGKDVKITLALGNPLMSNGGKLVGKENEVLGKLKENVPWQVETVSSILEALIEESKLGKNENWFLIEGNDCVGKRRLACGIAESVFGSADFLLHMNMKERENGRNLFCETLGNALRNHENLVVLVENVDFADTQFLKYLSDGFEDVKFGTMSRKDRKFGQIIFVLTKDDFTSYGDGKDSNSVIQMKLEVSENISVSGNKRKAEWDSPNKAKNPRTDESEKAPSTENANLKKAYTRQSSSNTLDLNIKAEDEDEENEITGETPKTSQTFLELIKNRFIFNRYSAEDSKIKDMILSKIEGSFEEVCKREGHFGCVFGVENKLLEEFLLCAGYFLNSQFEKWLKQVFETSLKTVNVGGKGGYMSVRLCLDRKEGTGMESSGYMNSCLPKKIEVSFMG